MTSSYYKKHISSIKTLHPNQLSGYGFRMWIYYVYMFKYKFNKSVGVIYYSNLKINNYSGFGLIGIFKFLFISYNTIENRIFSSTIKYLYNKTIQHFFKRCYI